MQYSDEEYNHLGEYTPAYLSRFPLPASVQWPNYSQNVAPVLAPAPDPLSTLANIPGGHSFHQHTSSIASVSSSNSTPHWTDASFSPASGAGVALFKPSSLHGEPQAVPGHHAHNTQEELPYRDVPRLSLSPMFGFQFQPAHVPSLPTNPFGTVDRNGSLVPGHNQGGRSPAHYRVLAPASLVYARGAPMPPVMPQAVLQHTHSESAVDRVDSNVQAAHVSKRKAEDDLDDTLAPDAGAVESGPRKRGHSRKGKGVAAARASNGRVAKSSQRGSRKKGRTSSDESTITSPDDLGPSVQADKNTKFGARPRTSLGRALESFNATKIASLLKLAKEIARAQTVHDVLALAPAYAETPTLEDMNSFKATLALVVATSGAEETTTCDACVADFEVAVPLPASTNQSRHESEYHRGLRTCPACSYLLVQRGTNGAERHRTWCPIWKALGTKGAQEAWLRQSGLLGQSGLLAIKAPSSQFFSEEAVKSAKHVAKGDRAIMERELLRSLRKATANDDTSGDTPAGDIPAERDNDGQAVSNLDNRVEGRSNAQYGSTGSCAPAESWHLSGIDILAGPEWDEDADGEYDVDVDYQIESGSALYKSDGMHEESIVASSISDGDSNAGVQSGEEGRAARAHGMAGRGCAWADSDDGAQHAAAPLGLVRGEISSMQSPATEFADELSRIHAGVLVESYGALGTRTSEAAHAGDWPSWEHGDVIERTYSVDQQSRLDSAATGAVEYDAPEAMRNDDPHSFDDTTATLQDLDDFYA